MTSIAIFWILIGLLLYSYIGYTAILILIKVIKTGLFKKNLMNDLHKSQPEVTVVVAAYNEEKNIQEKIENTFQQDYPKEKIFQLWVNDGSSDNTSKILHSNLNITVLDQNERQGKVAAINLAMQLVKTPITVFSDANAMLSSQAIKKLIEPFSKSRVGCVAGEKRIYIDEIENAASGEGIYWKYESLIKHLESSFHSTLSATGEIYAIRTNLFQKVPNDTILDDFIISTQVIKQGFLIKYIPDAYAMEKGSASILEEKKRKIRIAAGSFQALFRNVDFLNPLKYPLFAFQFFSHKILRWFVLPISLFIVPTLNILILLFFSNNPIYYLTLIAIVILFILVFIGWLIKNKQITNKLIFLPYYLFMMNMSIIQGFSRFITGKQNVKWEKSIRQT
ncbi:MAG: glycosyltransferase family 2 protein [Tenuifilaceae bacterium]